MPEMVNIQNYAHGNVLLAEEFIQRKDYQIAVDAFAELLNLHLERSLQLDKGTTDTRVDQIFLMIDDLIDGKSICGAGAR